MHATQALRSLSDRTINRAIRALALILIVGIPLVGALYWLDRNANGGPSLQERSIAAAEAAVRTNPNDLLARDLLAAAYVTAGRVPDGIAQYTAVLAADATNGTALLGRGLAYLHSNDVDLAKADFQAYVDANAKKELAGSDRILQQAYYQLGTIALAQDRTADAVAAFASALKIDSSDADALYGYGKALIATGDPTKGILALRRAVAFIPTGWSEPYSALLTGYTALGNADGIAYANGMVAFCAGRLDEAKADLRPLTGGALGADALIGLGYIAAQQGDTAGARSLYEQVLAKDPGNTSASIGLQSLGTTGAHASVPAVAPAETP